MQNNLLWSHFFDKIADWKRPAILRSKTPTQVLYFELQKFLKIPFSKKHQLTAFFVFSSTSVPIPKTITNRCGMECLNVKGVHIKLYLHWAFSHV